MTRFCPLPFVSVEATPLGKARACCLSLDDIPDIDLRQHTLEEAFNSQYMTELRHNFILGQHTTNCQRCWDEEAAGRVSKRMHSIAKLNSVGIADPQFSSPSKLQFIDLKLGNICNLKCRICGSFSSSKWAAEELAIRPNNRTARENLANGRWVRESSRFWENLQELIKHVKYFEFTGGEPFLISEHFDLLAVATMLGYSKNISIHYNTNTTVVPQLGLDIWPSFKHVEIAFSIDDLGARFEYQRYGAEWSKTQDNLNCFFQLKNSSDNIDLQLCLTVNALNFFYIDEMCAWVAEQKFDHVYFNVLHDAAHFSIKNLNDVAKKMIHTKFDRYNGPYAGEIANLLNFMDQGSSSDCSRLVKVLKQSDNQRGQKYSDHHPEMATAIGYDQ
jgi:sulfatase maturation enzyme AslB (radical SAM superfamily)